MYSKTQLSDSVTKCVHELLDCLNMNVSTFTLLFCIFMWPSQSQDLFTFTIEHKKRFNISSFNYTATAGSSIRFDCHFNLISDNYLAKWYKGDCQIARSSGVSKQCISNDEHNCVNVAIPSNFTCISNHSIVINNVQVEDSGDWYCRKGAQEMYSARHYVIVKPASIRQSVHVPPTTETSERQTGRTRLTTGEKESGSGMTTIRQHIQTTGEETTSNNFLLPVIGAAVCGVLIITIIIIVVVVKRKQSLKGRVETDLRQRNRDPEVETIDPDGQYASIGTMAASVAVPVIEPNPTYESYEGNQNKNQNQNRDEDGGISFAQGGEGDVYSVVNKLDRSTVQEAPSVVDTGGDVYSVVQKKQDPPATDGIQAGTPGHDQGISDVYSVVQKPGKTSL